MERGEAIAILKEIAADQAVTPTWVSLVNGKSGFYELHIKPESIDLASLELIVGRHDLALKRVDGLLIVYRDHDGSQGP